MLNVKASWFLEDKGSALRVISANPPVVEKKLYQEHPQNHQFYFQTDAYEDMYSMLWELYFSPEDFE